MARDVPLPRAVQEQSDLSDKLLNDLSAPPAQDPPAEPPPPEATVSETPTEPVAPPQPVRKEDEETYKQRYLTLQGIYNAEVPQLRQEVAYLQGQIGELSGRLQEAMRAAQAAPTSEQGAPSVDMNQITQDYGPELAKLLSQQQQTIAELRGQIGQLVQGQQQNQQAHQMTAEQIFWRDLQGLVPDYQALNSDPGFLGWLNEMDPYTGATKFDLLRHAQQQMDARRVSVFFNGYKAQIVPPAASPPAPSNSSKLEQMVTPPTSAATSAPQEKPLYTQAQVQQFYTEAATGKYRGRDAEYEKLDRDITQAMAEGRIR